MSLVLKFFQLVVTDINVSDGHQCCECSRRNEADVVVTKIQVDQLQQTLEGVHGHVVDLVVGHSQVEHHGKSSKWFLLQSCEVVVVEAESSQWLQWTKSILGRCCDPVTTEMKLLKSVETTEATSFKIVSKHVEVQVEADQRVHCWPGLATSDLTETRKHLVNKVMIGLTDAIKMIYYCKTWENSAPISHEFIKWLSVTTTAAD